MHTSLHHLVEDVYLLPLLLLGVVLNFRKNVENKTYLSMLLGYGLLSLIVFNIPYITYGEADLGKNMAVYSTVFDIVLYNFIIFMINITSDRRREFKEKYGVNQ